MNNTKNILLPQKMSGELTRDKEIEIAEKIAVEEFHDSSEEEHMEYIILINKEIRGMWGDINLLSF